MDTLTQDMRDHGKNKRKWKYEEDAKRVETLLDMVNLGTYKAENGFKRSYLNYVEKKMQVYLPSSGIFHIVYDVLNGPNTSGFGMDPIKKCITTEKVVWDSYIQSHPTHSSWQNKSFPFYDDLITNNDTNDVEATMENDLQDFDASISFSSIQSLRSEVHNQKKKKRSRSTYNLMVMADIKEAASVIGNENTKASQVFKTEIDYEIRKIPNFTIGEVIKVVCHIANFHELTDVFFSMTEEGRKQLVKAILRGDVEVFLSTKLIYYGSLITKNI
ncbi:hypothetical protein Pfo_011502 [Paulownia fortunei]|nr:hypothetical protein Pfo_011502 [Paulownia fortunei]